MKFYNPFRPHIVKTPNGKYRIRKFNLLYLCWDYLGNSDIWWEGNGNYYCTLFSNYILAENRLLEYNMQHGQEKVVFKDET